MCDEIRRQIAAREHVEPIYGTAPQVAAQVATPRGCASGRCGRGGCSRGGSFLGFVFGGSGNDADDDD